MFNFKIFNLKSCNPNPDECGEKEKSAKLFGVRNNRRARNEDKDQSDCLDEKRQIQVKVPPHGAAKAHMLRSGDYENMKSNATNQG